jgi:alkyl hydroperoxide reductase subunit AhpC/tRNA A-37 threonylcarbamoyl transferase component Bud32
MSVAHATVGSRAPAFSLPCTSQPGTGKRRLTLNDFQDRWLVVVFYPRDFSLVCPTELTALSARIHEFRQRDCDILGVSTDSVATHERWIAMPRGQGGLGGLHFPLASDEDGSVSKAYGVYLPRQHMALRGLFIIDPNGVLQYQVVHNLSVGRGSDEVLRVLDGLQSGGLCPEGWESGDRPLDVTRVVGPNTVLGQYRIESELGRGSFASVYRAHDTILDRPVALKVLRPDLARDGRTDAVLHEARAAAALNHPNVCTIFNVDAGDGVPMIVMEYVDGQPLSKLLENGPLAPPRAAGIGRQIALGMAAAHERGICHGDLKPGNILITREGQAKIMDFGLAQRLGRPEERDDATLSYEPGTAGAISGTPRYMSPEQSRGEPLTPASDVFSLGLILYEMLTGRKAVGGTHVLEVLRGIEALDAERLAAQTPEPFASVIRQALCLEPSGRNLSMGQIAIALATA